MIQHGRMAIGNPDHYSGLMEFCRSPLLEESVDERRTTPTGSRAVSVEHSNGFCFGLKADLRH